MKFIPQVAASPLLLTYLATRVWVSALPPDSRIDFAGNQGEGGGSQHPLGVNTIQEGTPQVAPVLVWTSYSRVPAPLRCCSSIFNQKTPEPVDWNQGNRSLYDVLTDIPRFSSFVKLVNFAGDDIEHILKDSSSKVTLFAFDNDAIPKIPGAPHEPLLPGFTLTSILEFVSQLESKAPLPRLPPDEGRRNIIKGIVHQILSYHILPHKIDSEGLKTNASYPTILRASDGSYGGLNRRIRVNGPFFGGRGGSVNWYARIVEVDIKAQNGVMHIINFPLIPPFSVLEQAYLYPRAFSTWSSAIQQVNLTSEVDYYIYPPIFGIPSNQTSSPSITAFVPTNAAWDALPESLRVYLFSPFGLPGLRALLQFHIVPHQILHAEWRVHQADRSDEKEMEASERQTLSEGFSLAVSDNNINAFSGAGGAEGGVGAMGLNPPVLFDSPFYCHSDGLEPEESPANPAKAALLFRDETVPAWEEIQHPCVSVMDVSLRVPTLLPHVFMNINITKKRHIVLKLPPNAEIRIHVSGYPIDPHPVPVILSDIPARNGVFHVISRLIKPGIPSPSGNVSDEADSGSWENWRDWFPQWVEQFNANEGKQGTVY